MTAPTATELAIALAFVVSKWKDTGADPIETRPFDDLLARVKLDPPPLEPAPLPPLKIDPDDLPPSRRTRVDRTDKLAVLDAEIDAVNREAGGE